MHAHPAYPHPRSSYWYSFSFLMPFHLLLEKDRNGDILWVWTFPTIADELRSIIDRKAGLQELSEEAIFVYGHYKDCWYYIYTTPKSALECSATHMPDVSYLDQMYISKTNIYAF